MATFLRVVAVSPETQTPVPRARRPEEVFSRDGPLGSRADVRVLTSDAQELWLHRVVLEMWSSLFRDLIAAHEEEAEQASSPLTSAPASPVVTLKLTETGPELMLLLSCLYPASHTGDRKQSSALDVASFLPLLGLADKFNCPSIIERCASFAVDHIMPRLAAAPAASVDAAAEYLQLSRSGGIVVSSGEASGGPASRVVDWVVQCLELAVRMDLDELVECTASLLGRRFFDWGLQDPVNGEFMARVTRVLSSEQFVRLVLRTIPSPPTGAEDGTGTAPNGKPVVTAARRGAAVPARAGGAGGGGGPRIVPVVVAAAGPAAAALQQQPAGGQQAGNQPPAAAAAAPAPPQPLAGANWWQPPQPLIAPAHQLAPWLLGHGNGGGGGGPMLFGPGAGVFGGPGLFAHHNQAVPLAGGW